MDVYIISIDHSWQLIESDFDSESLTLQKDRLRRVLRGNLAEGNVGSIFEESSLTGTSIASQLATQSNPAIPWHNICMTPEERSNAGVLEALSKRPGTPDWDDMSVWIEYRIPADEIREQYFVIRIEEGEKFQKMTLVLLGDMHTLAVAKKLLDRGHNVEWTEELIPRKLWAPLPIQS